MRASGALLLRGMRWRLGTSVLTVLTSAIAVGAAVLGPLYLHTAGDWVVRSTVASAPIEDRGATLFAPSGQQVSLAQIERAEQTVQDAGGHHRWYGTAITSVISGVRINGPGSTPYASALFFRSGICATLRFQQGSCRLGRGDVVLSDRTARQLQLAQGARIYAGVAGTSAVIPLRVTGIYAVPNLSLPYWWGTGPGDFPFGAQVGPNHLLELDPLIASAGTALAVPPQDAPSIQGQVPLRAQVVGLGNQTTVEHAFSGAVASTAAQRVALTSDLPALLADAGSQRHTMATIIAIAAVQLVLLAIWILASLLVRSSDARAPEMRVARLRGFPAASMLGVTAAEPAVLCLIGVVMGVAGAWVAVAIVRDHLLNSPATISADGWTLAALGVTVAAIIGALAVGTRRLMGSTGLAQSRTPTSSASSRVGFVVDAMLLVLSGVALIALATSGALAGHRDPIASAAPGLIALGVAVLAVQAVLFSCRLGVSASAHSDRVAAFLALRQIVRRPAVLRQARVLIIAVCLACFAIAAWSVARSNRATAAQFSVGASTVVTVAPGGASLEQAVDRVDPAGRYAMAVEAVTTPSSLLLAVDAPRLPVAASWPSGISRTTVAAASRALVPRTAPEVSLPAAPVRVAATTTATLPASASPAEFDLGLWVFNRQSGTTIVTLGPLHSGAWVYQGAPTDVCSGGCRLAGLGVLPAPGRHAPSAGTIELSLSRVSAQLASGRWAALPADLFAGGWRPTAPGVEVEGGAAGSVKFVIPTDATVNYAGALGSVSPPMASPADHPSALPGVVTSSVQSLNGAALSGGVIPSQGFDGNTISVDSAVTASALPRIGSDAVMVDLDLLGRLQVNPVGPTVADQVWLGPSAPADAVGRLRAAGLHVEGVQTAAAVFRQMQRSGPALADDFLLVAAIVALLAAAASTLGALGATTRQRATELTALEVGGIRRPVLVRSLALESSVLALTALFGVVAGVIAAVMAIPSVPELAVSPAFPLQYGFPDGLVAGVAAAVVGAVLLAAAAVALLLVNRMSPGLLRTAPNDTAG